MFLGKLKFNNIFLIIMVFVLILSACSSGEPDLDDFSEYNVIIEIVDAGTGEGIENVTLELEDFNGNTITAKATEEIGVYEFENVKLEDSKEFEVSIKKDGYIDEIVSLVADSDTVTAKDNEAVELEKANSDAFAGGSGTESDPYLIETDEHLNNVRNYLDSHFKQIENINLNSFSNGKGWEPIGEDLIEKSFKGSYNGNGYEITNLTIDRPESTYIGLFGHLGSDGDIDNIVLSDIDIIGGDNHVGGLVGRNNAGSINNSFVKGNIEGKEVVGGLVGGNFGEITNCHTEVNVVGNSSIGGLAGSNPRGDIISSYAKVDISGDDNLGGLSGINEQNISNSYAIGFVEGNKKVGGLVGRNNDSIKYSYAAVEIDGENIGGLIGDNVDDASYIEKSYWDKNIGPEVSDGGQGKTTNEMQSEKTFEDWDFIDIWDIDEDNSYPYLQWQDNNIPTPQ